MNQLRGKVKIFLKEKGYGFIFGDDDRQYFFYASDVAGADLPQSGDTVVFEGETNSKGLKATQVHIKSRATKPKRIIRSDDREKCIFCEKRMVPRIILRNGEADHSICPYCGEWHEFFGSTTPYKNPSFLEKIWGFVEIIWEFMVRAVVIPGLIFFFLAWLFLA